MIFVTDVVSGLESCSQKLTERKAMEFIASGAEQGMDTQYKITIKKCKNKEGFVVSMSVCHIGGRITLHNISGLPLEETE